MIQLKDLSKLEQKVASFRPEAAGASAESEEQARLRRENLAGALTERGSLKAQIGFARLAVLDLMRAQAQLANLNRDEADTALEELRQRFGENVAKPAPFTLSAQLGEALRLEARDVFLSSPGGAQEFHDNILRSVVCFTRALKDLEAPAAQSSGAEELEFGKASQYKAWILAHRGAAYTTKIWILLAGGKTSKELHFLFTEAERDLRGALEANPTYAWGRRFLGVLLTLKADSKSLDKAARLLRTTDVSASDQESSLHQSLALLAYIAANELGGSSPQPGQDARMHAIEEAIYAANTDPERFVPPYIAAASLMGLFDSYSKNRGSADADARAAVTRENVGAAIDAAIVHARNALSQATACLIGGLKLRQAWQETQQPGSAGSLEAAQIGVLARVFESSQMDLETAAMILKDPNLAVLRAPATESSSASSVSEASPLRPQVDARRTVSPLRSFADPYSDKDSYLELNRDAFQLN